MRSGWRGSRIRRVLSLLISLNLLGRFLRIAARSKVTHDIKAATLQLGERGIEAKGFSHDVMLSAFLLEADPSNCACEILAEKYLDEKLGTTLEARADCALALHNVLWPRMDERGFRKVYDDIDLPLVSVLTRMERSWRSRRSGATRSSLAPAR